MRKECCHQDRDAYDGPLLRVVPGADRDGDGARLRGADHLPGAHALHRQRGARKEAHEFPLIF